MKRVRRKIFRLFEFTLGLALGLFVIMSLQLISNSRFVSAVSSYARYRATAKSSIDTEEAQRIMSHLKERTQTYIDLIESEHIENGMVVNRFFNGAFKDECDSLIFSAIYFAALNRLGSKDLARERWLAIEKSQFNGRWVRHPLCLTTPPSRDMLIGVLVALNEQPRNFKSHLTALFTVLEMHDGFFGNGPALVSYLSPGVAEVVRKFSVVHGLNYIYMPDTVRRGFSTIEWSVATSRAGFRLHLTALQAWLEMELNYLMVPNQPRSRTAVKRINHLSKSFISRALHEQRLEYISQTLVEKSPKNLFFKFLRFQAASAMSQSIVLQLAKELLAMQQFPEYRLPNDCDRRADYLWQRADDEYVPIKNQCQRIFSGVDFVWMSALLQEAYMRAAQ